MTRTTKILALETSCDETAAAVIECKPKQAPKILSSVVFSQILMHKKTKGIVPEVSSRAHTEKIIFIIQKSLLGAEKKLEEVDALAITNGPGLIGSLLVGIDTAKTLAFVLNIPLIPINHIEAHIYANFVDQSKVLNLKSKIFPAVVLIVSGGHTQLILMRGHGRYKLLGSTLDDAAGEAFDKVANILSLGYPGGPAIDRVASSYKLKAKSYKLTLPRPMIDSDNFDFSFSGLKTAVLYLVRDLAKNNQTNIKSLLKNKEIIGAIAYEFQQAMVDVLAAKTIKAARKYKAKTIMLGGGVAANKLLRLNLKDRKERFLPETCLSIPKTSLCTDNAAIIGICACYKLSTKKKNWDWHNLKLNLSSSI